MILFLNQNKITYRQAVPKKHMTGINQEVIMPLIVYPDSENKPVLLVNEIRKHCISYDILGGITNNYLALSYNCEGLNRFVWDDDTTEEDFYHYINTMQRLAKNRLMLEIEIKK